MLVCLSICPSVFEFVGLSVCLSDCLWVCGSVGLWICGSVCLSVGRSVCRSVGLSGFLKSETQESIEPDKPKNDLYGADAANFGLSVYLSIGV
jgi:hypothetical protein